MAPYPSGKGEVCKTFMRRFESARRLKNNSDYGIIIIFNYPAWVAELVDAQDLKSCVLQRACGFESRSRHNMAGSQPEADAPQAQSPALGTDDRHYLTHLLT